MVNVGAVLGSTVADVVSQSSIPEDSFLVGFGVAAYAGSVVLAYAYKV